MAIVSLNSSDEKTISTSISQFLATFGVINLLCKCGGSKLKGVSVQALFTYTLTNVFRMGKLLYATEDSMQRLLRATWGFYALRWAISRE